MEFLEIVLVLIGLILIIAKPEKEKLAFGIVIGSWALMAFIYLGSKAGNILPMINL